MKKLMFALVIVLCSGCGISTSLELYRVDERKQSTEMTRRPVPWKCYFSSCTDAEINGLDNK